MGPLLWLLALAVVVVAGFGAARAVVGRAWPAWGLGLAALAALGLAAAIWWLAVNASAAWALAQRNPNETAAGEVAGWFGTLLTGLLTGMVNAMGLVLGWAAGLAAGTIAAWRRA